MEISFTQSSILGVACAERLADAYFWVASCDGREGDMDVFRQALDQAWHLRPEPDELVSPLLQAVRSLPELHVEVGPNGVRAHALYAAIVLRLTLEIIVSGETGEFYHIAETLKESCFFLDEWTGSSEFFEEEHVQAADLRDVAALPFGEPECLNIRERSRAVGRRRLSLLAAMWREQGF